MMTHTHITIIMMLCYFTLPHKDQMITLPDMHHIKLTSFQRAVAGWRLPSGCAPHPVTTESWWCLGLWTWLSPSSASGPRTLNDPLDCQSQPNTGVKLLRTTSFTKNVAQLVERQTDKPLRQVWFPPAARDFSPHQLPVQILLWCLYSHPPHPPSPMQLHALTSDCTLNIPSTGSHTFVWTHESTACTVRNG